MLKSRLKLCRDMPKDVDGTLLIFAVAVVDVDVGAT